MSGSQLLNKLKNYASSLKKEITALYYAYKHSEIKLLPKILIIVTLAYAMSPVDLIPDFIPILGYCDDLIVIPLLLLLSIKCIPKEIMEQARERAVKEPVTLKKNWFVGVLFMSIWVFILVLIIVKIT